MWSGRLVPNKSVGQAHHTNRNEIKRTMAGKTQHQKYQNIRTSMEHMILIVCQLHHWVRRPNIHPPQPKSIVGNPLHQWVVPWNFHQGLLLIKCIEKKTCSKRVSDKVYFKNKYIKNPTVTPEDTVIQEAQQFTATLKGNVTTSINESEIDQLKKLDAIFNKATNNFRQQEENHNSNTR